jgi:dihydropteroate synthase
VHDEPEFRLSAHRPLPGAERHGERWTLRWRGPALMGVLNVTPDSFSDGGLHAGPDAALAAAEAMAAAGALFVDVGGESTRPGATPVEPDEERRRLLPVVEALAEADGIVISVDTRRPEVAREALSAGAHLVNDVGGLRDPAMRAVCAEAGAPAVAMHMRGEPATMQDDPVYDDVVREVDGFLRDRAEAAEAAGVPSVVVDPGWGFGKRDRDNLALLRGLPRLAAPGRPVLLGASRKGTLGRWTGERDPARRDPASLAVHLEAARLGAAILRVHDVAGHAQALAVRRALGPTEATPAGDRIVLEGMSFHGYHGVFEEEARIGAPFLVDVELRLALSGEDVLARTVDYAQVYALVAEQVTGRRFRLIEALASAIAERALGIDPRVAEVTVRVHKPHAPLPGVVRDVVVEVVRDR